MKKAFILLFLLYTGRVWCQPCTPNTNSIELNGTSDFVSFPSNSALNITAQITVEAWIYPTQFALTPDEGSIICKHGWSSAEAGYVLRAGGSGQLAFNIAGLDPLGQPTSWKQIVSPVNSIQLNTWTHVAGTFDGDSINIYVNGQLISTLLFTGTIVNSPNYDLKIGRLSDNQPGQSRFWTGLIDEARVWDHALSSAEITANMNTQIDPALQTGLAAYWRLNDGTGTVVSDLSVNSISGTLNGGTWSTNVPFSLGAPPAIISPTGNTTFCDGGNVTLNANSGTGLLYLWSTGATTQSIVVNSSGSYTVTVSDGLACSAVSSPLTVTVNPTPPVPTITLNGTQLTCSAANGLQWYLNGNTLFNQVGQNYTPTVNGSYTVIVTSINGCTATSAAYIVTTLGIEGPEGLNDLNIGYNIQNETGTITFDLQKSSNINISFKDIQGRTVKILLNEKLKAGKREIYFNTNRIQSGIYYIVLANETGLLNKKILIIK